VVCLFGDARRIWETCFSDWRPDTSAEYISTSPGWGDQVISQRPLIGLISAGSLGIELNSKPVGPVETTLLFFLTPFLFLRFWFQTNRCSWISPLAQLLRARTRKCNPVRGGFSALGCELPPGQRLHISRDRGYGWFTGHVPTHSAKVTA
jgi:hypothetical protein